MVTGSELAVLGTIAGSIVGVVGGIVQSFIRERNANQRHWTNLMFAKKYEALLDLNQSFKNFSDVTLRHAKSIEDILDNSHSITEEQYIEILNAFNSMLDDWNTAKILVRDEDEKQMRKGMYMFSEIIGMIEQSIGHDKRPATIHYDDEIEFEDFDDYKRIIEEFQDKVKKEIEKPVEQFR